MDFCKTLSDVGILPVICLKNEEELNTFEAAILETPIKCFEITMRHQFSYNAIRHFKEKYPQFIVGAGTVTDPDILNAVADIGVDFCVSPGFDEKMITQAQNKKIPFIPGCATPSEILNAQCAGLKTVKLFPAECMGGVAALKLYASAFQGVSFLPKGGITLDNFRSYLSCVNVLACGGSFMIPKDMLEKRDAQGIRDTINKCIEAAKEIKK